MNLQSNNSVKTSIVKKPKNHFDYMLDKLIDSQLAVAAVKENIRIKNEVTTFTEMMNIYDEQMNLILTKWYDKSEELLESIFDKFLKHSLDMLSYRILIGYDDTKYDISEESGIPVELHLFDDLTEGKDQIRLIIDYYIPTEEEVEILNDLRNEINKREKKLKKNQTNFMNKQSIIRDKITKKFINTVIENNNIDKYFKKEIDFDATNLLIDVENFTTNKGNENE